MEFAKSGRKKNNGHVGNQDLVGPKRNRYHHAKSIEDNEKMVEEMQQQMLQFERKITEKKLVHEKATSRLSYNLRNGWPDGFENFQSDCPKKMVLDKLTFANSAYRDKKVVVSFSSGEREINIHNLNHRMLHEAPSIDGERRLLKMLNPNNDIDSGFSLKQLEQQMGKLYYSIKWPQYNNLISTSDGETTQRTLKELKWERDQVFINAPCKASLWNALPSTKDLRMQIQAMEARDEEKRKMVLGRRKKIESKERKIKKAENEIKSMRKMMENIRIRKQKALEIISHEKSCLEKILISRCDFAILVEV